MRTFAKKPKASQQTTSAKSKKPSQTFLGQSRVVHSILHLQRTIGNHTVQRLIRYNTGDLKASPVNNTSSGFVHDFSRIPVHANAVSNIQPKLKVNIPGDQYEQEADRVAELVLRMPDSQLSPTVGASSPANCTIPTSGTTQNTCTSCSDRYERALDEIGPVEPANHYPKYQTREQGSMQARQHTPLIQEKATADSTPEVTPTINSDIQSLQGRGSPLSGSERSFFEPRFGADFSNVRIHTDTRAANTASLVNARAFTHGNNVVFGAGQYSFDTLTGRQLLAHELVHVLQQNGADGITRSPYIMRTCDCSNPREHPLPSTSDFLRQRFPSLTSGTYCLTGPAHSRYNCYGHSVRSFRAIGEQEIVEQYGRRTYGGENSILYGDLHSFYASRGYIPQGHWQDCLVIAYGTGITPKHVARRSNIRCHGRYLYESKLGLEGPEVSHYPEQLEGSYYGTVHWGYIRGRLPESPDFPTMIPYQQPQRFIPSGKLENRIMLSPLDTPEYPTRTPYRQPLRGWQYLDPSFPEIVLKILHYDRAQSIPSRDLVRNIYHRCGIRVRFHVLPQMNRQDTLNDLNGDTNLNLGQDLQASDEVQNILSRIGSVANNEVPIVFVENIVDQRYRSPAGRNIFGVLCAISNNTTYPAVVMAHEIGHYFLGEGHVSVPQRLMHGVPTNQSTILSTRECSIILSRI